MDDDVDSLSDEPVEPPDDQSQVDPGHQPPPRTYFPGMQEVRIGEAGDREDVDEPPTASFQAKETEAYANPSADNDAETAEADALGADDEVIQPFADATPATPATPVVDPTLTGREQTLVPARAEAGDTGLSGREQTLVPGATPPPPPPPLAEPEPAATPKTFSYAPQVTGREQTLIPGSEASEETGLSGREQTLVPGAAEPDTSLSGREQTLVPGAGGAGGATPPPELSGREQTLVPGASSAAATPPPELSGREQTLVPVDGDTAPTMAPDATVATRGVGIGPTVSHTAQTKIDEDTGTAPTMAPFTIEQEPQSGKPRTRATSSAGFDAGWHLQGRKGHFTGQTWGDFELGGILGEGGMGAVYRGLQSSLKRRVAIKVLPPNLAQDRGLLQRFHLEASTASRLTSPHIVQVYFIGEHEGNHYYAMEYVEGTDLYDIMKDRQGADNPLTPNESSEYILQAAKGLVEADRIGVVHRDIKPPNMMVDRHGLLKLADFGIVKVLGESQLTMTGQAVGTPAYVSPEQGRGDSEIDQRSDLYSLGVVFYELCCGRKPFEATTPNSLIYKHCFEEPELPQKVNEGISDEIQAVILKLLQKKPDNRYQSAQELVTDLEAIKTGNMLASALASVKGTGADEAKREQLSWVQRNLLPIAGVATLVIAVAAYGGYDYITRQSAEDLRRQEVRNELVPKLQVLDGQASIPAGIEETLARYIEVLGEDDRASGWQGKLDTVADLQRRLQVLDKEVVGAAERMRAGEDLGLYEEQVGTADAAAVGWRERLTRLQKQEDDIRARLKALPGFWDQTVRDRAAIEVGQLAALVSVDDPLVQRTRQAVTTFDERVAALEADLKGLATRTGTIPEQERVALVNSLEQFKGLVGEQDRRVLDWGEVLNKAGDHVDRLRSSLGAVFNEQTKPPLADIEAVAGDLKQFAGLVGADDGDLQRWRGQIVNSQATVAILRKQLTDLEQSLGDDGIYPAAVLEEAPAVVDGLQKLAGAADKQVMAWRQSLNRTRGTLDRWRTRLQRLHGRDPVSVAEQLALAADLDKLVTKAGLTVAQVDRYRTRLAAEAQRVGRLRTRLQILDDAVPFTDSLAADLGQFLEDVGNDDTDGARWRAKQQRIIDLRERLAVLDQQASVPENVTALFQQLIAEVGDEAPEVVRWQKKVALIDSALAALAPLATVASIPEAADEQLAVLAQQVGSNDPLFVRYRAKVDRARELITQLAPLPTTYVLDPAGYATAMAAFVELRDMLGRGDTAVQQAAVRLRELGGPDQPAWADRLDRDAYGLVATMLDADGLVIRFRFVPSGRAVIGSPDDESGRDRDEIISQQILTKAFWLAETELTQQQWQLALGTNPSRFVDPQRPVERIAVADVQALMQELSRRMNGATVRLPTETEWEYACRVGGSGPWDGELEKLAWFATNSGEQSHPVAQRYPNALGLYDMHGNVAEWVADDYQPYPTSEVSDHLGRGGNRHVARGGSWGDGADQLRAANRIALRDTVRSGYLGVRVAVAVAWPEGPLPSGDRLLAGAADDRQVFSWTIAGAQLSLSLPVPPPVAEGGGPGDQQVPATDDAGAADADEVSPPAADADEETDA